MPAASRTRAGFDSPMPAGPRTGPAVSDPLPGSRCVRPGTPTPRRPDVSTPDSPAYRPAGTARGRTTPSTPWSPGGSHARSSADPDPRRTAAVDAHQSRSSVASRIPPRRAHVAERPVAFIASAPKGAGEFELGTYKNVVAISRCRGASQIEMSGFKVGWLRLFPRFERYAVSKVGA